MTPENSGESSVKRSTNGEVAGGENRACTYAYGRGPGERDNSVEGQRGGKYLCKGFFW